MCQALCYMSGIYRGGQDGPCPFMELAIEWNGWAGQRRVAGSVPCRGEHVVLREHKGRHAT